MDYGLRDYDSVVTWEVNGQDKCDHDWKIGIIKRHCSRIGTGNNKGSRFNYSLLENETLHWQCKKCGAWKGELGQEPTPQMFIDHLMEIFNQVKRVLRKDGTCFVVISDSSDNNKGLLGIPEQFMLAMIRNGWKLRRKIIWHKPNGMPASVKDAYTIDYENVYFFSKSEHYYFKTQYRPYSDASLSLIGKTYNGKSRKKYKENNVQDACDTKRSIMKTIGKTAEVYLTKYMDEKSQYGSIVKRKVQERKESRILAAELFDSKEEQQKFINWIHDHGFKMPRFGGNKKAGGQNNTYSGKEWMPLPMGSLERCVWRINTQNSDIEHYATFPEQLVKKILDFGCPEKGTILDCFLGSGTTALVALKNNRNYVGIEYNKEYCEIANERLNFIKNIV